MRELRPFAFLCICTPLKMRPQINEYFWVILNDAFLLRRPSTHTIIDSYCVRDVEQQQKPWKCITSSMQYL